MILRVKLKKYINMNTTLTKTPVLKKIAHGLRLTQGSMFKGSQ